MSKNTALAAKIYADSIGVEGNALRELSANKQCRTHCRYKERGRTTKDRQQDGCQCWLNRTR